MPYHYNPKTPVRTFHDLEVYQKTLDASVIFTKDVRPALVKLKHPFLELTTNCAMAIPLYIAEAHSLRFGDHTRGILLLERAMAGCNKMIVYLEHIHGAYGAKLDTSLLEDLAKRYSDVRGKIFRLEKAWQKFTPPQSRR